MAAVNPERSLTRIGRYRMHALHAGSGKHLVLLHGLSGSSSWWRYNIPAFAPHFRTHTPDLVGFGRSRGWLAQPTIAQMAELIVDWLDAKEIDRLHLIGHSMGGQIAIHMAAEHAGRIEKLVLVSAAGIPRPLSVVAAARFLAEIIPPKRWGNPAFLPSIAADALRAGPRALLSATNFILRDDVRPLLPRISVPTLLIWGKLDPMTPLKDAEAITALIPQARLIAFDDAAHMPMVDQPERFNREVLQFLTDQ